MRSFIFCLSWLSLFGSAFGGIKLPLKGERNLELPVSPPRVLQWYKQGPPKGVYPQPPPVSYPYPQYWTRSPYPTTAGSVPPSAPPMTSYPTHVASAASSPTKSPSFTAHQEACNAVATGAVYKTSNAVSFAYFYELLTTTTETVSVVSSDVDKSIQASLATKLVGCSRRRLAKGNVTILGVSQSTSDSLATASCSNLKTPSGNETCYTLQSALTVYLEKSFTDASLSSKVFAALSALLDGGSLVNQQIGIYGLYFVGANLPVQQAADTSASSTSAVQTGQTTTNASSGLTHTPGAVAVIALVCLTVLVVAFFVMRRGQKWPAAHKAGIIKTAYHADNAIPMDDEKSTPTANASFDREVGMFIEYDDDESNGYGKVLATSPIIKDMDKAEPTRPPPPLSQKIKGSWFASRSRSPQFGAEGESVELQLPPGTPKRPPVRKYSVENTVAL